MSCEKRTRSLLWYLRLENVLILGMASIMETHSFDDAERSACPAGPRSNIALDHLLIVLNQLVLMLFLRRPSSSTSASSVSSPRASTTTPPTAVSALFAAAAVACLKISQDVLLPRASQQPRLRSDRLLLLVLLRLLLVLPACMPSHP